MEEGEAWEGVAYLPLAAKYPHPQEKQSHLKTDEKQRREEKNQTNRGRKLEKDGLSIWMLCVVLSVLQSAIKAAPGRQDVYGKLHPANQPKSLQ